MFRVFAAVFDAWLTVLEAMPPQKTYKNGKGMTKPRMSDALKD
jgi:hypothetical protein